VSRLELMTWTEVDTYLKRSDGIMIPVGSTEQHGPIGIIGTDSLVAQLVAWRAAKICGALVAPTIGYTPAPFNESFPGTISVSSAQFSNLAAEIALCLARQGFKSIYFVNGHGANVAGLRRVRGSVKNARIRIRSWWEFEEISKLRKRLYGKWEGMHATPSEIAITQHVYGSKLVPLEARQPPKLLSKAYILAHAGDRHGPADQHRREFPDGRVGSHSALASPEHGKQLLSVAAAELARDYLRFLRK